MNPHQYNLMYKHLVRPSREKIMAAAKREMGIPEKEKVDGQEILNWVNYNTKVYGNNEIPLTPEERKTGDRIEKAIANGGPTANADQVRGLKNRLNNARQYTTPPKKKKQIKKVADSSLTKPQTLPKDIDKYLDLLDPKWWLPEDYEAVKDPAEEARLRHLKLKQMEEARLDSEGIRTLLKPKRLT